MILRQVHGASMINGSQAVPDMQADAAIALVPGVVCAGFTADCLPVLLCDRASIRVPAVHAS
jgi:polyphenol oxidase